MNDTVPTPLLSFNISSFFLSLFSSFVCSMYDVYMIFFVDLFYGNKSSSPKKNLFTHLEKYVGISGNAIKLIKSYFSGRTQRVMIDGILSDVACLICGVPQGSVQGPLKFCLYLLLLAAILRYHNIGYHVYADDTQLYISFKNKAPSGPLARLNSCISDIQVWMIKNNLKNNDSKTEFIIFRFPQCEVSISGVAVSVGNSNILPSPKVRDLGVIFDECLTLDGHISNICRRAHCHLRNIGRIRMLLSFEASSQLIHALLPPL